MNIELLKELARIESGSTAYIDGDVLELREIASSIGNYLISPIGNGKCKVSRIRVKERPFIEILREALSGFSGEPISFKKDAQYVRTQVSVYNRTHGTQFRVHIIDGETVHVISERVEDYAWISQEQFAQIEQEAMARLARFRDKVRRDGVDGSDSPHTWYVAEAEADNGVPKGKCADCGDEYTKFGDDDIYCEGCHVNRSEKGQQEPPMMEHDAGSSAIATIRCEECTEDFIPHKEGATKCADCAPPFEWDDDDVI